MVLTRHQISRHPPDHPIAGKWSSPDTRFPDRSKMVLAHPTRHPISRSTRHLISQNGPRSPNPTRSPDFPIRHPTTSIAEKWSSPPDRHPISRSLKNGPRSPVCPDWLDTRTTDRSLKDSPLSLTRPDCPDRLDTRPTSRSLKNGPRSLDPTPDLPIAQKWSSLTRLDPTPGPVTRPDARLHEHPTDFLIAQKWSSLTRLLDRPDHPDTLPLARLPDRSKMVLAHPTRSPRHPTSRSLKMGRAHPTRPIS